VISMKQNITLSLDPELLRGARVLAAQRGTSVSKLLAAELERLVRDEQAYHRAREQALNHLDQGLHLGGGRPERDSLHER
jgi:hypothetical protein